MSLISIRNLRVNYGKVEALRGVSLGIQDGEIVVIIGANGAGKSTLLRTISGLVAPLSGEIWFMEQRVDGFPGHQLVKMGISHVPEGRRLFPKMTVWENLMIGSYLRADKEGILKDLDEVLQHLPILKERRKQRAGTLSGGEQQMLTIGRALMSRPKFLLLDEPSLGLAPLVVKEIASIIRIILKKGMTIALVEQNAHLALRLANRGYVLEVGRVVLEGESQWLLNNEHVRKAYLGG
jgi:branched-chain amino acid transport system ATP-binding protein